jgi:type VI secretion system protein ImpA
MSLPFNPKVLFKKPEKVADDALLNPIPGTRPTGEDVRYTGDYESITEARREDNAALPRGVWQRELKRADWASVERLCTETLAARAKDLQVAAWLCEARVRLQGFAGLARGLDLLGGLCERFWPDLHPTIEEHDLAGRIAPLEWLNDKLPELLRSLPVVTSVTDPDEQFSWTDYVNAQRLETVRQRDPKSAERAEAAGAVTLARFGASRQRTETEALEGAESALNAALRALDGLNSTLQQCCGDEAPGLGGIRSSIEETLGFLAAELADRQKRTPLAALLRRKVSSPAADPPSETPHIAAPPQSSRTREEAYHQLAEIADFLLRTEPHSPTPYLIRRAAEWGKMTLPELVEQLSQSGSDISGLLFALGVGSTTEEVEQDQGQIH